MKLAFFDIECASVYKNTAKICAFGYVLCDENFKIEAREDILINPKGSFHLTDSKGEKGLVLPYKYDEFKKYPEFRDVFPKIRQLLEADDILAVGHATYNDVNYLNLETRRFSLPSFNFNFSDTQLVYMTMTRDFSRQLGLEFITRQLGVEFTPHRAADDAYATMKIAEAMCRERGCDYSELERSLCIRHGKIADHRIEKAGSAALDEYIKMQLDKKEERSRVRKEFYLYLSRKRKRSEGILKGKIYNFSHDIEDNLPLAEKLIDRIYLLGGEYTQKLAHCNVYVAAEDDVSVRTNAAKKSPCIELLTLLQFMERIK